MGYAPRVGADTPPRIAVEGLAFEAGRDAEDARRIVDDVSFRVAAEGVHTVLGPSGSGMNELPRCLNRLVEPGAARVLLDGRDASQVPVRRLAPTATVR